MRWTCSRSTRAFRRSSLASSSSSRSHSTSFRRGGRSVSDVDVALRARETGAAGALWRSLLAVLLPILIVAMELGVYLIEPRVLSIGNLRNILIQSSYLVLFASAQMVVILTRGFDLSLGASVSAISVASALVMTGLDAGDVAPWIVVLAGLGSGPRGGFFFRLFYGRGLFLFCLYTLLFYSVRTHPL